MKKFTKAAFTVLFLLSFSQIQAQDKTWKDVPEASAKSSQFPRVIIPKRYRVLELDTLQLLNKLKSAPFEFTAAATFNPVVIGIPMPDGKMMHFNIVEYSMMEPGLQEKFPNIRTYNGQGIEDRTATIKIDWTDFGFHAMILSPISGSVWIDPYARGSKTHYISYFKKDLAPKPFIEFGVLPADDGNRGDQAAASVPVGGPCLGTQLRTYRLAVACTGEYAVAVGGTTAPLLHSAIVTSVNRVNGVFETEVAVRLVLIANNNLIEYLNAGTDLFTGNSIPTTLINESQSVINSIIGAANYDIGHTFSTGGGGYAQLGCVCTAGSKARGVTGTPTPTGDGYDIDFVAHEMGHQFGGEHTFNATTGNCNLTGDNSSNAEPGSGTTIMAYAGICAANDVQLHSDPQFHAISFNQIGTFTRSGNGSTCGTQTNTGNSVPVVNAVSNYSIPINTPFTLTGSATDANGDALTYSWEQIDVGGAFSDWNLPTGAAPLFRSFAPTTSGSRSFPSMTDLANNTTTIGEILPSYARDINFRLTARDNRSGGGGVCYTQMKVTTVGATAFNVTSQAVATNWVANGSNTATITWTVAGTTAAPFNVANVDILLSVDGGLTFPYTLLTNTANDGTQVITIPSATTTKGRIMVRSVGNIFFDINVGMITISSACSAEGAVVAPSTTVTAVAGDPSLNLGLSPQYSSAFLPAGSLTSTDPASNLAILNTATSACIGFANEMKYDAYTFVPSISATYTFTLTGVFPTVMNLYSNSFDPLNSCTNFLRSNGSYTAPNVSVGVTITQALTVGSTYVLVIGTFSNTQPTLPAPYSVAVSSASPAGGSIYAGTSAYFNPGAGFNYAYVIVNNATNVIAGISATANLTNTGTYPAGTYSVFGLSYANTIGTLASYIGGNLSALMSSVFTNPAGFCANFSKNIVTVVIQAGPVPVNNLQLTARKDGTRNLLTWKTSSEQQLDHFNVQRSADGIGFTNELGRVNAVGNSQVVNQYPATDAQPLEGWNYYRIEAVDVDGRVTLSNIASVNVGSKGNMFFVYPNPAAEQLNIEYNSQLNGNLTLQVIDSKGSIVLKQTLAVTAGRTVTPLHIGKLASGVYFLRYTEPGGNTAHTKFIKK